MKISSGGIGAVATSQACGGGHLLARGGKIAQVTDEDDGKGYHRPQWYPDGTQLVLHSNKTTASGSVYAIWKINIDGSGLTQLTFPGEGVVHAFPAVSQDGTKLAYHSNEDGFHNIYTINTDGSGSPTKLTTGDTYHDVDAAWNHDDSKIVFRSSRDSYSSGHPDPTKAGAVGNPEIYVMDAADGGNQTRITTDDHKNLRPSFSPDGTKIIFDRELNTESLTNKSDIWIMDYPGGGNPTRLTESLEGDSQAVISPDGTKIAWGSGRALDDGGKYEIYVMNIDGSGVTRMTANIDTDYQLDWSPDGTQIAFSSNRDDNNWNIFIMDVLYGRLN